MSAGVQEEFDSLEQRSRQQERNQALQQETLHFILQFLRVQPQYSQHSSTAIIDQDPTADRQPPISSTQVNHLTQSQNAGGSPGPAGHGS